MPKLNLSIFISTALLMLCGCDEDKVTPDESLNGPDRFIFGHFYGECSGEGCVETYKLEDGKLFEDTTDVYPSSQMPFAGDYIELSAESYALVKDIVDLFPETLYDELNNVIGNPDGADWGGIYVEVYYEGNEAKSGFWLLDQNASNMPDVYNTFVAQINDRITWINQ